MSAPVVLRNGAPLQEQIERASIRALIEKSELEGYQRYREMDEYNNASAKELQALDTQMKALQQERQQRNSTYSEWELANRARIDGLRQAL